MSQGQSGAGSARPVHCPGDGGAVCKRGIGGIRRDRVIGSPQVSPKRVGNGGGVIVEVVNDRRSWKFGQFISAAGVCRTYELAELPGTSVIYNFYYDTSAIPYTLWGYLGGTYYPITPYPSYAPLAD